MPDCRIPLVHSVFLVLLVFASTAPAGSAVQNLNRNTFYSSIQAAVNDANAGDRLRVVAQTHNEGRVSVDRSITLEGTGQETVFSTAVGDPTWFFVAPGVELQVRDLNFDGSDQSFTFAFNLFGGGSFSRTHFAHIRNGASPPSGTAILVNGDRVDISESTFVDFGRSAFAFSAQGFLGIATDNVIECLGNGAFFNYGIQLNQGAVATIERNVIAGCSGTGDSIPSAAIHVSEQLEPGTTADVVANTLLDNSIGIEVADSAVVSAQLNRFSGNGAGISIRDTASPFAEYNWWGCNAGPQSALCDSAPLNADFTPWLVLTAGKVIESDTIRRVIIEAELAQGADGSTPPGMFGAPDGTPVRFSSLTGTICNPQAVLMGGTAQTRFLPDPGIEEHLVGVTVDQQTAAAQVVAGDFGSQVVSCDHVFGDGFDELTLAVR